MPIVVSSTSSLKMFTFSKINALHRFHIQMICCFYVHKNILKKLFIYEYISYEGNKMCFMMFGNIDFYSSHSVALKTFVQFGNYFVIFYFNFLP